MEYIFIVVRKLFCHPRKLSAPRKIVEKIIKFVYIFNFLPRNCEVFLCAPFRRINGIKPHLIVEALSKAICEI